MKKEGLSPTDALEKIVRDANTISCDEITNSDYWNEEWTECPVCGCKPDKDGLWIHEQMQ